MPPQRRGEAIGTASGVSPYDLRGPDPDRRRDPRAGTTTTGAFASVGGPPGPPGPPERDRRAGRAFTDPDDAPLFPVGDTGSYTAPGGRPASRPGSRSDDEYGDDSYNDDAYFDEYDDYDNADDADELPKRRGCRNAMIVLVVLLVASMVAAWFGWSWVQGKIDPSGGPGEVVLVEIPEGTSTAAVGQVLADAGVISNATVWDWYTKVRDVGTIQAGKYEMQVNSSFSEAIDALGEEPLPPEVERMVTIPEGLTQGQIAARLTDPEHGVPGFTAEGVQAALADPASRSAILPADEPLLEGTLFPETYAVEEGDSEATMIQRMVAQFDEVAADVDLVARAEAVGRTPYEVLIIASMVEREAGTVEDGPRVARVIYNRLAADEPLGIDATSCYEKGQIPCELTTAELEDNTAYDTRFRKGMVPTPIASPGRASIEAALAPAEGDWMWYILDVEAGDGSSFFTNDFDEFNAAKERCVAAGRCG